MSAGGVGTGIVPAVADRELRAWVEHCLGAYVYGFERHPLAESTSELLTFQTGGRTLELYFKDYGRRTLPREDEHGPRREIELYRQILDTELLGTARHVGSLREPEDGRTWLLLERVRGARLSDLDLAHWHAAAAWLGRLHGHAAARGIAERPPAFLPVQDLAHLSATAEEALRVMASIDSRLERDLRDAVEGYEAGLVRLAEQPHTLVHGSFVPENILVDTGASPPRVTPIDWGQAALGCSLYDVASLVDGLKRDQRDQLLHTHREAALEFGVRLPEALEARELVAILRQYKILRSLGQSVRRNLPVKTIEHQILLASGFRLDLRSFRHKRNRVSNGSPEKPAPLDLEPVLRAWHSLGREERVTGVQLICGAPGAGKKRAVYRLRTTGSRFPSVVAKASLRPGLATERFVYDELLPRLPLSTPSYLGWAESAEARWLFIEDVGALRASREDSAHRACCSAWLGALHATGRSFERDSRVPDRTPQWFLASLLESRQAILASLENPALSPADRRSMRDIAERCGRVASRWDCLEDICREQPVTLVHADFQPKNLYLRPGSEGLTVIPIDWEYSCWSVPALDLGTILRKGYTTAELEAYASASGWDAAPLPRWVSIGCALRAVLALRWAIKDLPLPYPETGLRSLPEYALDLEHAFEALGA